MCTPKVVGKWTHFERKKAKKNKNSVDFQQSMFMIIDNSGLKHLRSICITKGIVRDERFALVLLCFN